MVDVALAPAAPAVSARGRRLLDIAPYFAALTVIVLSGLFFVLAAWTFHDTPDAMAYREAAQRLISGGELYPPTAPDGAEVYRYAPWFAFAWMPLAVLPLDVSLVIWRAIHLALAVYVIVTVARIGGRYALALALLGIPLLGTAPSGNAGILITALLLWRRADPWSVGIAASLKIYPLFMVVGYIAERRWRDVAIAVGVAGLLWLPALWFGIEHYVTSPGSGGTGLYAVSPELWLGFVLIAVPSVLVMAARRYQWTWLAVAAILPMLPARAWGYDLTYLWAVSERLTALSRGSSRR